MTYLKVILAVATALTLSACATTETVSRSVSHDYSVARTTPVDFQVEDINVTVPSRLRVSEANLFYPIADIVWRGDVMGNRHEQVAAIFEEGMARGAKSVRGHDKVVVDVQVLRFHSLTERARYTVGGVHSIKFVMTVRDAHTGDAIMETKVVRADLDGFGGSRAIAADHNGMTQKVRITAHLAQVLQREMALLSAELNAPREEQLSSNTKIIEGNDAS